MDGAGVMYARRLSCRQWYAGYEKTLCHDIHSHDTESGQGSAPYLTSTLALPSCFTLGQELERVSALGTHLINTLRPPWMYIPFSGTAFSLRPCRSYMALFSFST